MTGRLPGSEVSPISRVVSFKHTILAMSMLLTSLNRLDSLLLDHACIGLFRGLSLENRTRVTSTPGIQSLLQSIALPSKEVITVPAIAQAEDALAPMFHGSRLTMESELTGRPCYTRTDSNHQPAIKLGH